MDQLKPTTWEEKFEALKFISETHRTVREQRRKFQSKVFYTAVTFFALIVGAKFTGKFTLPQEHNLLFTIGAWILLLFVATLSTVYILGLHAQSSINRKIAESAETQILSILGLSLPEGTGRKISKTRFWEIAVIFIFAVSVGISITFF